MKPLCLIPLLLMAACAPRPGSPEAALLAQKLRLDAQTDQVRQTVHDSPAWFTEVRADDLALYASGTAMADDWQVSLDLAVLAAKRQVAEKIADHLSAELREHAESLNGHVGQQGERTTIDKVTAANLGGYRLVERQTLAEGPGYRSYVLLAFTPQDVQTATLAARAAKAFDSLDPPATAAAVTAVPGE